MAEALVVLIMGGTVVLGVAAVGALLDIYDAWRDGDYPEHLREDEG